MGTGSHMNGSLVVRRCALKVATQTQSHMDPQLSSAVTKKLTTRLFFRTCHRMRSGCSEHSSYSISLPQHLPGGDGSRVYSRDSRVHCASLIPQRHKKQHTLKLPLVSPCQRGHPVEPDCPGNQLVLCLHHNLPHHFLATVPIPARQPGMTCGRGNLGSKEGRMFPDSGGLP